MNKIGETAETEKKREAHETTHDALRSAEDLLEEMVNESEKEVAQFQKETHDALANDEARAEKEGLEIDQVDRKELDDLGKNAEEVKEELKTEISEEEGKEQAEHDTPENIKNKTICPNCGREGNEIAKFCEDCGKKVEKLQVRVCAGCGKENKMGNKFCEDCGKKLEREETSEAKEEKANIVEAAKDSNFEEISGSFKSVSEMKERVIENPELLSSKESSKKLLAEDRMKLAQEIREQRSAQRGRLSKLKAIVEVGQEKMEGEHADEQFGKISEIQSHEANVLAERITSENLEELDAKEELDAIYDLVDSSEGLKSIKKKLEEHYKRADNFAKEKFEKMQKSVEQTAIRNGAFFIHTIQEDFRRHNELSNVSSESTYEDDADILLSLEPSISASSIFSGRSEEGKLSGLWSNTGGFILGGGDIRHASRNDLDSKSMGIKDRIAAGDNEKQSITDIDHVVSKRGEVEMMYKEYDGVKQQVLGTTYNEFIIDNPRVFGYYQPVGVIEDEDFADGKYWAGDPETQEYSGTVDKMRVALDKIEHDPNYLNPSNVTVEKYQEALSRLQQKIAQYKERFEQMASKGNMLYIMTPDRKLYEYLGVNDDGTVNIGKQLTPEEVATGRAGLSVEKRKEIGERILQKKLFKKEETMQEAREIIDNL